MLRKVEIVPVAKLSKADYDKCYRLNNGTRGTMQSTLREHRNKSLKQCGRVFMIKDGRGRLLSWSLVFPYEEWDSSKKDYVRTSRKKEAHFFTRGIYRRRGFGSQVMKEVLKHTRGDLFVHKHDEVSSPFFEQSERFSKKRKRINDA